MSKQIIIKACEQLTDWKVKESNFHQPASDMPEAITIDKNSPINKPLEMRDSGNIGCVKCIAGIQVLWPVQPYCSPVQVEEMIRNTRTAGCQSEVDISNQTRIQTFKPLNRDELLTLEPHAAHYRDRLQDILYKHRPAFAADLHGSCT